jgi:organic radical activating enzyme
MSMKARLIVTYKCPRNCEGCCNKNWKGNPATKINHFNYDQVIITGGEPLLFVDKVIELTKKIRLESKTGIILYTAMTRGFMEILPYVDGICLTLHDREAMDDFNLFLFKNFNKLSLTQKSLRLNIFKEAGGENLLYNPYDIFKVKDNIIWLKDCPLPSDEELFELPELLL